MTAIVSDLRFALRTLAKRPGFTFIVVLTLGLGIGAATALIDLVNLLAWRRVPVARPGELVKVYTQSPQGFAGPYGLSSYPDYMEYRDAVRTLELAGFAAPWLALDTGETTLEAQTAAVSGSYFATLDLGVTLGRPLMAEDDQPGGPAVMVIHYDLWQRLGGDPEVIGRTLRLAGQPFTVVGVTPQGFNGTMAGMAHVAWFPIARAPELDGDTDSLLEDRTLRRMNLVGRLRPGHSIEAARAELAIQAERLDREYPMVDGESRELTVIPGVLANPIDLRRMKPSLRIFALAAALLIVITCANVAHLLLARATARRREMGIRQSLGAHRRRLLRQLLTESLLLAFAGGFWGLLLAFWARALFALYAGAEFAGEMRFDYRVLGASLLVCLLTTALFGVVPALVATRVDLVSALKDATAENRGRRRVSAGQLLAAAQVALSLVLLATSALLTLSLENRFRADLGFSTENLSLARVDLGPANYSREEGRVFFRQLRERVSALPGVRSAGMTLLMPPVFLDVTSSFRLPEDAAETKRSSRLNLVDSGYFETLGIALEQGRAFAERDAGGPGAVIVNRKLATELWPGESPLGKTVLVERRRPWEPGPEFEVVGVVGNVSQHRSSREVEPILYFSVGQRYRSTLTLALSSSGDPGALFEGVRAVLREMNPDLILADTRSYETHRRDTLVIERLQAQTVSLFGAMGFGLAILGIFGVMSYAVSQKTREIGIRMALGARRRDVQKQVVRRALAMAAAGVAVGLVGAVFSSRLIEGMLFGVEAADPAVFGTVIVLVLLASAAAAYLPARRASRVDPLTALRYE